MKQLEIIDQVLPVISINFDEVKASLSETLSKYEGIIVTEETLTDCVAMQKELSRVRREIDAMRLDTQREVKKPLDHFTSQMKELMGLVIAVEDPIKKGMQVFEDKRKSDKLEEIDFLIAEVKKTSGLISPFSDALVVVASWTNKGTTMKHIEFELSAQVEQQMALQNIRKENLGAINEILKGANEGLTTPLDGAYYIKQLDNGTALSSIMGSISGDAKSRKEAEKRAVEAAEEEKESLAPPVKVPVASEGTSEAPAPVAPATRTVKLCITTTDEKFQELSAFLKSNGIGYEKID